MLPDVDKYKPTSTLSLFQCYELKAFNICFYNPPIKHQKQYLMYQNFFYIDIESRLEVRWGGKQAEIEDFVFFPTFIEE